MPDIRASIPASNYTKGRGGKAIDTITFHHIVGDAGAAIARFRQPGVEVSSTYIIGSDGQVYYTVDEANTPYTNGNYAWNQRSITIEHAGGGGGVPYTEAMYQASTNLVRSIISRHNIKTFNRHRDIVATACPGGLNVERIVNEAKGGSTSMKIGSEPNWRWRMNLLHHQLVGNWDMSDEVFRSIIGKDAWSVVESWSSHSNAPLAQKYQEVGQVAVNDKWDQQIYNLQDQVKQRDKVIAEIRAKADLSESLQKKVDALEAQAAQDQATGNAIMRFLGKLFRTSN